MYDCIYVYGIHINTHIYTYTCMYSYTCTYTFSAVWASSICIDPKAMICETLYGICTNHGATGSLWVTPRTRMPDKDVHNSKHTHSYHLGNPTWILLNPDCISHGPSDRLCVKASGSCWPPSSPKSPCGVFSMYLGP